MPNEIEWERDYERARQRALNERKQLLIDVIKVP